MVSLESQSGDVRWQFATPSTIDVVVGAADSAPLAEVIRVLRSEGTAYLGEEVSHTGMQLTRLLKTDTVDDQGMAPPMKLDSLFTVRVPVQWSSSGRRCVGSNARGSARKARQTLR